MLSLAEWNRVLEALVELRLSARAALLLRILGTSGVIGAGLPPAYVHQQRLCLRSAGTDYGSRSVGAIGASAQHGPRGAADIYVSRSMAGCRAANWMPVISYPPLFRPKRVSRMPFCIARHPPQPMKLGT